MTERPLRLALLTYSTKPRGGVVHTLALAEALASLGVEVTVWTLGRGGDNTFFREINPAVRVRVVPFTARDDESVGQRILRSIDALRDAFEPHNYDLVHAQDCISANAVDDCIRTVHHLDTFETPELIACHERAIRNPRALVCVSAAVAGEVQQGWNRTATVIPNGVDADRFAHAASDDPTATLARQKWQSQLGRYILAVGGIEPRKGTRDLLEAFARLTRADASGPALSLVIAGGETLFDYRQYRREFDERAVELGIPVRVLGTITDPELPSLVAGAAALGFVSTKEGFGLAAMEALAAGVPVVARDLPVIREVFGDTVRYGSDIDGFTRALTDSLAPGAGAGAGADAGDGDAAAGSVSAQAGRALAESYTWPTAARAHLALYTELLAHTAPSTPTSLLPGL